MSTKKILASTAGAAAAAGLTVAAIKKLRAEGGDGAELVYHVKPDGHEDGWRVAVEGQAQAGSHHDTKRAALDRARELAHGHAPSRLVIHRSDGTIQRQHAYSAS